AGEAGADPGQVQPHERKQAQGFRLSWQQAAQRQGQPERVLRLVTLGVRATITAVHRYEQDGEAAAFPALRPELARLLATQDFGEAVRGLAEHRTAVYHGR